MGVHKAGGALMLGTFAMLLLVPWLKVSKGALPAFHPLATVAPVATIMSLNLLGKMGFGAITFGFSVLGLVGVGKQEAFQLLWTASAVFYALTYLVMFALPVAGFRGRGSAAPLWVKAAAISGFAMTLLYVGLSIVPSPWMGPNSSFT